ncbi:hypothetical protein [Cronobacter sakazakii]|uniref:hypothetical protein n=1 Tax=Cronobacter sakazakii TaxID=28141 RepID=UPI0029379052|nr:hypothetical protein [Cronobacter sakazakii]ELQ5981166.1 hypothetical protein [Cronobacter sakazakii]ELY3986106.1 hypothetical protein [Cronobacter sakazakii]ELY4094006.1 hypothetical protein [Cronobacter sakazakii]ELY4405929.1 hypothetical protein [Cronobacter sakazakii]ELY4429682.1 hypothetical protein [Cronobacter sakazakii]
MLEKYLSVGGMNTTPQQKRVAVVEAALEIAKASVGHANAAPYSRTEDDLKHVAKEISNLADAIEKALQVK